MANRFNPFVRPFRPVVSLQPIPRYDVPLGPQSRSAIQQLPDNIQRLIYAVWNDKLALASLTDFIFKSLRSSSPSDPLAAMLNRAVLEMYNQANILPGPPIPW